MINFTKEEVPFALPSPIEVEESFGTYDDPTPLDNSGEVLLRSWEAVVYVSQI